MPKKSKTRKNVRLSKKQKLNPIVVALLLVGAVFLGYKIFFSHAATSPTWHALTQAGIPSGYIAYDIGGGDGAAGAYIIVHNGTASGLVYRWNGNGWSRIGLHSDLNAISVTADTKGPWVSTKRGYIYRWNDATKNWVYMNNQFTARDISAASDNNVYASAINGIYKWTGLSWQRLIDSSIYRSKPPCGKDNSHVFQIGFLAAAPGHIFFECSDDPYTPLIRYDISTDSFNYVDSSAADMEAWSKGGEVYFLDASTLVKGGHLAAECTYNSCNDPVAGNVPTGAGWSISADWTTGHPWLVNYVNGHSDIFHAY